MHGNSKEMDCGQMWDKHGNSAVKKVAGRMGFVGRNSLTSRNPNAWSLVGVQDYRDASAPS